MGEINYLLFAFLVGLKFINIEFSAGIKYFLLNSTLKILGR